MLILPEDGATNSSVTLDDGIGQVAGIAVNHLQSQEQSLQNASATDSDISFSHSQTDLPSLVDQCLTDTVTEEIDVINCQSHSEFVDDVELRSALSTPPLHSDLDNDIISTSNEHYMNGLFCCNTDSLLSIESAPEPFDSEFGKDVSNCFVGSNDMVAEQLNVNTLLHQNEADALKNDAERTNSIAPEVSSGHQCVEVTLDAVDSEEVLAIAVACDMNAEDAVACANSGFIESRDAGDKYCDTALTANESVSGHNEEESVSVAVECTEERVSSALANDSGIKNIDGSFDCKAANTEHLEPLLDNGKTDVDFVAMSPCPFTPLCIDTSNAHVLSDGKENIACDISCDINSLPGEIKPEILLTAPGISDKPSVWNADDDGPCESFLSNMNGPLPTTFVASFSSLSNSGLPCDETWVPDWKLQTNATVVIEKLVLPANQYYFASKSTAATGNKSGSNKEHLHGLKSSHLSEPSKLASVQPVLSKIPVIEEQRESDSSVKATLSTSEIPVSASCALVADVSSKQLEEGKQKSKQGSETVAVSPCSSASNLSVVSSSRQEKSDADYLIDSRYQPVVRLVRLPLEFFRMLQQTSKPVASSSVPISDLPKRFVALMAFNLYTKLH